MMKGTPPISFGPTSALTTSMSAASVFLRVRDLLSLASLSSQPAEMLGISVTWSEMTSSPSAATSSPPAAEFCFIGDVVGDEGDVPGDELVTEKSRETAAGDEGDEDDAFSPTLKKTAFSIMSLRDL